MATHMEREMSHQTICRLGMIGAGLAGTVAIGLAGYLAALLMVST